MKPFSNAMLVLVFGALVCVSSPLSATVLFQDDFEGHNVGDVLTTVAPFVGNDFGAQGGSVNVIADISTVPPGSTAGGIGAQFVQFVGGADCLHPTSAVVTATAGEVITTDMDVYIGYDASASKNSILSGTTPVGWNGLQWQIGLATDGSLSYYDNGADWIAVAGAGTIHTDQWIHVDVVADYTARSFTATVDGYSFSRPFAPGTANTYDTLYIGAASFSNFFYDNVSVTSPTVPEPSSLLLMISGLLGLLAYAWRKRK